MPLPDIDKWERGVPEPAPGFVFVCQSCGEVCNPRWGDYGHGAGWPPHHLFCYRSACCYAEFSEEVAKDGKVPEGSA